MARSKASTHSAGRAGRAARPALNGAACGCNPGAGAPAGQARDAVGPGAHAVGVDAAIKAANLKHLKRIEGQGTGPIDGFINALSTYLGIDLSVADYSEHSLQHGSNASAIAYVEMVHPGGKLFGAGINTNIVTASLEAIVSAANRVLEERAAKA